MRCCMWGKWACGINDRWVHIVTHVSLVVRVPQGRPREREGEGKGGEIALETHTLAVLVLGSVIASRTL